jgi:predicted nucleotidyltransferase
VRVFGSVARREDHGASDLDLLVDLVPGSDLFDIVAIKQGIAELLGRNVHVLTEGPLRPSMRERVLREAVPL